MAAPDADVAVVGAGPAGAAAALFAARAGYRVLVFDRATFPRDKPCGEGLMPSGRRVLAELGVEDEVVRGGAPSLDGVVIAHRGRPSQVGFPRGERGLGVRRSRFDAAFSGRLDQEPAIDYHQGVTVEQVVPERPGILMTSAGEVRARFVAVADGLRSSLRRQLGWTQGPKRPHRYGVVGHWRGAFAPESWVRLILHPDFESYRAPVGPDEHLLALLCNQERMAVFGNGLADEYRRLALAAHPDLSQADLVDCVSAIGPFRYRATTVARDGIYLIGDAAGFVDPITGEGLATGLQQAKAFGRALGHPQPEAAYRRWHRAITRDQWRLTSLFVYLASNQRRVARALRGLRRCPSIGETLLGVNLGYWGFGRVSPREWVALLAGW